MLPIRTILYPTDFSDAASSAFELACALARDYGATLIAVHVIPPPHVFAGDGMGIAAPVEDPEEAAARLAALGTSGHGGRFEYRLLDGDPTEQILKVAGDTSADVIVMGTHGSSGLMRLLMGSIAESVMRKAPCPVLTVRGQFHRPLDSSAPRAAQEVASV
ncbi:Putative universal stress protein [Gemmata sp. SH-PL17]|uniref:universal stress protein n=1 Tax=Gemmata sp. SH-PL17 TaxID=1630693 RepID=UPI0004AD2496|nr:universal stress protein [Gemmata sp. SH-PL17]AMV26436.1 Putative universal stress protein [Gemmata sp. SH-PL17]